MITIIDMMVINIPVIYFPTIPCLIFEIIWLGATILRTWELQQTNLRT